MTAGSDGGIPAEAASISRWAGAPGTSELILSAPRARKIAPQMVRWGTRAA